MPGRDRTGPMGMGPMTGRGMGYCTGFLKPRRLFRRNFGGLCLLAGLIGLGVLCVLKTK